MSDNREYRSQRFAQLVGLELKGEFAKHSISQTKVAEILGHSKGGYSKWINAKPSMPLEAFLNTCELIEADPKAVIDASYKRLLDELGTPDEYRAGFGPLMIWLTASPPIRRITTWPPTPTRTRNLRRKRQEIK